jgi:hypothetical protein
MSDPHLPAEMLDHIVDHLHNTQDALRNCCLVSKSWIPRTRTHLFADIRFRTSENLRSWKGAFPDPSTCPARYAKTLFIGSFWVVAAADTEAGGWIRGFSRVERLVIGGGNHFVNERAISLAPFHGFSPILKSLRMAVPTLPSSRIFNLIHSFPLLEDLAVIIREPQAGNGDGSGEDRTPTATQLSSPPVFTGSLELRLGGGMERFARQLVSLPGGIHFRKLIVTWVREGDLWTTMALVRACTRTLESLDISKSYCTSIQHLSPRR